jgi:hypothetical protein
VPSDSLLAWAEAMHDIARQAAFNSDSKCAALLVASGNKARYYSYEAFGCTQEFTANPRTDAALGRVGR